MKKIKSKYLLLIFPFLIILGFSLPNNKILELAKSIEIYASVLKELDKFYAEEIQPKELVENSIESMLEGLDPYTSYYPEEEIDNYLALTTGKYEGIGIVLNIVDKKFYVFDVEEGSPAEKANLHIGDQIIKVNNEEISGLSQSEVNRLIAGKSGTKIELTVQSIENQEIRAFDISRSTIHLKNIHYYQLLDEETGIIDLNEFNHEASNEFKNAFLDLKKQGMKKLIIDLSSNPGGLLTQAVEICNYFIPKNKKVVVTKGKREEWNNTYFTINNPLDETIPIIIIIDPNTASASEILAGVLQEYDRALILGQKSYGKGLVQITRDLPYRTKIKLTTARYYLPSGRCIQKINYFNSEITDTTLNYQTQNGRPLTNTGGISPDFQTVAKNFLPFFQFLVEKDLIFKYTLQNFKNEKDIINKENWKLKDSEVDEFIEWVKVNNQTYSSNEKQYIDSLYARTEKNPALIKWREKLLELREDPAIGFEAEANSNKEEIRQFLSYLMIAEKWDKKTADIWNIPNRIEIKKAKELFKDPEKYKGYLSPK